MSDGSGFFLALAKQVEYRFAWGGEALNWQCEQQGGNIQAVQAPLPPEMIVPARPVGTFGVVPDVTARHRFNFV